MTIALDVDVRKLLNSNKKIIENHKGYINAESKVGERFIFKLLIPA